MNCPKCDKPVERKNYCADCQIYICPRCKSYHDAAKQVSWPMAVLGMISFPFVLIGILLSMTVTHTPEVINILSNEKCHSCGKRFLV